MNKRKILIIIKQMVSECTFFINKCAIIKLGNQMFPNRKGGYYET